MIVTKKCKMAQNVLFKNISEWVTVVDTVSKQRQVLKINLKVIIEITCVLN